MKQETKIALASISIIFTIFNLVRFIFFPEMSWQMHAIATLGGAFFILVFGLIIRTIDLWLDKIYPFDRGVVKRIALQFFITLAVLFTLRLVSAYYVIEKTDLLMRFHVQMSRELFIASFVLNIFMVLSVILSIFGYHYFRRWRESQLREADLQREKTDVLYDNLKNQLNPHFLFNSLSSLDGLIHDNPDLASKFLQQLSKVYRYVLQNKDKTLVTLETEIIFVKNYTSLLQTRFQDALKVEFNISDAQLDKMILPVTLQILIENAIKHNITQKDSPLIISIETDVDDYLVVKNNLQPKGIIETSNKQGLARLKSFYRFLIEREIAVEETADYFAVKVPLIVE